jgi:hypothetical protein
MMICIERRKTMRMNRVGLIGAVSALAILAVSGQAKAQSAPPQVVTMPPGFVAVVAPDGSAMLVPAADVAMPALPDPFAMMRQMQAQMQAQMNAQLAAMQAAQAGGPDVVQTALGQMPAVNGPVAGVSVMTVSDGKSTCTERVVYPANGGKVEISAAGNGCGNTSLPGTTTTASPAAPPVPDVTPAIAHAPVAPPAPPAWVVADRN